jgi:4-methylaminobutanoate oxidase (formaldehyde-forming)
MIDAGEPIDQGWCEAGNWEIDIAGTRYPARASLKPMYDPQMKRIRA